MSDTILVDKSDRQGLYLSVIMAALGIIGVLWITGQRLVEVATASAIPVLVPLAEETAQLPLGPGQSLVTVDVETATVLVDNPAPATLFALWAHPIAVAVLWIVGLLLAARFCLLLARGEAFTRRGSRMVMAGAILVLVGWFVNTILQNMSTNGAFAAISNYEYDSIVFTSDFTPVIAALALSALAAALQIGEKLQREQEGLV